MARSFLSIVVPAYNEDGRIVPTLESLVDYLSSQSYSWEVLVVDDGSSDGTAATVGEWSLSHDGVRVETIPHGGKGWAVRHGMLATIGEYRFMCDADLAMPIDMLGRFMEQMGRGYDIVIGSREVAGARRFDEPAARHVRGRVFNRAVRLLAVGGFQDTQCGFKCFKGEAADQLFSLQRTKGFGFDVEILYLAVRRRMSVLEMPIDWYHKEDSKIRAGIDSFSMLRDTVLVRWRDLRGEYRKSPGAGAVGSPPGLQQAETLQASEPVSGTNVSANGLAIVVPTYNEAGNLPELADRIFALGIPDTRIIVVDDGSPDGTAEVARELAGSFDGRVEVIERSGKQGLGTAYVRGFSHALAQGAGYVLQMDADLSHAPEYIPALLKALDDADVVVGSRYVPGGGVDEVWSPKRRLVSYLGNLGIRLVAGLKVKDATSGFKAFRGSALSALALSEFRCNGFGFQSEVAHACQRRGYRVIEYPIVFQERTRGRSKMSVFIVIEALWRLLPLRWKR